MFTQDFKPQPYWWDLAPLQTAAEGALPASVDVLVIGSGFTGLQAALQVARAGRSVLVLEAGPLGFGASTRNGGQVSTSVKLSLPALTKRFGRDLAVEIHNDGQASLDYLKGFVEDERIACDLRKAGRFHGAHTAAKYEALAQETQPVSGAIRSDAFMVPRAEQHSALGTDAYFGGIVFPHHASINPGLYHTGLLERARAAGAVIVSDCAVVGLERSGQGFTVTSGKGVVAAKRVIVATNGYTGALTPWHQRRVIPIGSYVIATEELPQAVMDQLMPTDRILSDTRKLVYYYRPSPDRKRILFGGRVSLRETNPTRSAVKLRAELVRLFPQLRDVGISHSWTGFVGYTFDTLAHMGEDDGLFYAMGYCGSGVGMASYLGFRIGQRAVDNPEGATAFEKIPNRTRPFYRGNPWFLAPSVMAYRIRDRLGF